MDYPNLSNTLLLQRLRQLAAQERRATADFIACLAEAARRPDAILSEGYPSLFEFCVKDLKLAESTAYQRVKAAQLARRRPEILSYLAEGSLNVSTLSLVAPHLAGRPEILQRALGKSKREVEALLASLGGPREVPDRVRPLAAARLAPEPAGGLLFCAQPQPQAPKEATPVEWRVEFRFAAGRPFVEAVERLRALLWHKHPDGRLEDLLYEAAADFLARKDPGREPRLVAATNLGPRSRRIQASLRRQVWRRDQGRCAFVGPAGRCPERKGLEIDHVVPWALGGASDDLANLRLLCRPHNQSERRRVFGSLPG